MVSFRGVGKLTVEFCGDQCWKWFRKSECQSLTIQNWRIVKILTLRHYGVIL